MSNKSSILYYVLIIITLKCNNIPSSSCSRILAIFPIMARSHQAIHQTLINGLASKGHQVTVLNFFNGYNVTVNYSSITLRDPINNVPILVDNVDPEEVKKIETTLWAFREYDGLIELEKTCCLAVLSDENVQNISQWPIDRRPELLIVESLTTMCYNSLAEKLDVPLINSVTFAYIYGADYSIGNPLHPSSLAPCSNDFRPTNDIRFYQRLINLIHYVLLYITDRLRIWTTVLDTDEKYVGNKDVSIDKLRRKTSLTFFNNHFSFISRHTAPNSIDIGGIILEGHTIQPLPSDIKKFIETAENGVIYFSFGTVLRMSGMSKEKLNVFERVFRQLPQRVLWKSDRSNLTDNMPGNVMIRKWLPQRDVLEHKNVKAFITHGGISSIYEAIHTARPIIGIPFLFDQHPNVNRIHEKGAAIRLDYDSLNYEELLQAINDILNDRSYLDNMRKLSVVFKDRPMSPLDTAIYWVEYVIRHKGALHMRLPAADMPFYKFLLLDVIGFVVLTLSLTVCIGVYIIKRILRMAGNWTSIVKKNQ